MIIESLIKNKSPLFDCFTPKSEIKGILSIPHSGEEIPEEFKEFLSGDTTAYAKDVDYKVDALVDIEALRENGIIVIVSHIHRITVDLNRARDIALFSWENNSFGECLVKQRPSEQRSEELLLKYYDPYFELLGSLLKSMASEKKTPFSFIDLHSMPSKATNYHLSKNPNQKIERPDFCISNRSGDSSTSEFIDLPVGLLKAEGHEPAINDPYFGGHITVFANEIENVNNIQIEINRDLYMDEVARKLISEKSDKLKAHLTQALISTFNKFS
ncbi:MAG: N-formylglutamate amidohydrolase [Bacteriovoracaceae bacterium]|jgi:N-formylglutamate amidohydrolase|nr:N-formylglutamate amidohydrolase [Bacteriovoracaceae bacterium]